MKNINFSKHILPHLIAVVVLYIITAIFFNPVVFDDKVIEQHDITQWRGGAQELITHREKTGEEGLWTNSMFSGMPAYLVNTFWSDKPVKFIKIIAALGLPHPVSNIFLAFISYYILLLSFGVRPYLAIGGAIAFGLSTYNIVGIAAGHNARIGAVAFMPLVIAGAHITLTRSRILGFGVTTVATALHLMENHLQITYYLLLMLLVYGIIQLIDFAKRKELKELFARAGIAIAAALIALLSFAGSFWSTWEYSKYSMRGPSELAAENRDLEGEGGLKKDYAFQYSNGIFEPLTLMIPNVLGGASTNYLVQQEDSDVLKALQTAPDPQMANQLARYSSSYWGPQPLSAPYYIGAIICFFFALGIVFADRKYVIWLVIMTILGIMLSWGDNFKAFNYFMFEYFPAYNKFRSVTFTLILPIVSIPLLGFLGLEKLMALKWTKEVKKKFIIALAFTGGLCLLIIIISGMFSYTREVEKQLPLWFLKALRSDRQDLLISDAFRSLVFILLAAGLLWLYKIEKLKTALMAGILTLLITIDVWAVDKRLFGEDNFRKVYGDAYTQQPLPVDVEIKKDKALSYRVYNLQGAWSEARTSYHHKSIGGYHGAKMRRYQDLYDLCLENETIEAINDLRAGQPNFNEYGILNMLNAKYLTFGTEKNNVIQNPGALGNAWMPDEVIRVNSPDEEIKTTCQINPADEVVIDVSKFDVPATIPTAEGNVKLTEYAPNKLVYQADLRDKGLVVFSEIYYPAGWQATVDGEPVDILRVNYVLRALIVPEGQHTITFEFKPDAYFIGDKITMAGSWLVLLIFLGSVAFTIIKRSKKSAA
ncbi:MAG: YfhO family protein [Candidatus Cyclobacteriaceae bacterium M2_1C_046]